MGGHGVIGERMNAMTWPQNPSEELCYTTTGTHNFCI